MQNFDKCNESQIMVSFDGSLLEFNKQFISTYPVFNTLIGRKIKEVFNIIKEYDAGQSLKYELINENSECDDNNVMMDGD